MTVPRWNSYNRRKQHALFDRIRTLAKQGHTDEQIAKIVGLPELNVRPIAATARKPNGRP
jgi:DNA-directed RNA polymerase sigma subunit (sigma70/sigma32)